MIHNLRSKVLEKSYAIALRKKGFSYNEIIKRVPAAKSSISLWLKDTPLSEDEKRLLKTRRSSNISLGRMKAAAALRSNREARDKIMLNEMRGLFEANKAYPLFIAGICLYWAEGAHRSGGSFLFTNSDPSTHNLVLDWLERYFHLPRSEVKVRLFNHRPFAHEGFEEYWAQVLGVPRSKFQKTVYKPTGKLVKKRPGYKGCLRIELTKGLLGRRADFLTGIFLEDYTKGK